MTYNFYNDDVLVARFNYDNGEIMDFTILNGELLPKQISNGNKDIFSMWIWERAIDLNTYKHRELAFEMLGSRDKIAVSIMTHMFSISDKFTCFPKGEFIFREQLWNKEDQDSIADFILLSSDTSLKNLKLNITPNISTDGSFVKTWKYENNAWWLYKIQNKLASLSEYWISKVLQKIGWNVAEYELIENSTNIKTKNFVDKKEFFEPYDSLRFMFKNKSDNDQIIYNNIASLGKQFEVDYRRILLADALFMNSDRHMRNFGVIRSTENGRILRMAPNFDNNQAYKSNEKIPYSNMMLKIFEKSFGLTEQDKKDIFDLKKVCLQFEYMKEILKYGW